MARKIAIPNPILTSIGSVTYSKDLPIILQVSLERLELQYPAV
jgi:hypothetical protein